MTTKLTQFRRSSAALAALAACLLAGPSFAASPDGAYSVRVPYGDLNLTSDQGVNTLHARLAAAAREVCGEHGVDGRDLQAYAAARSCQRQAVANAERTLQDMQVARLAARHE